MTSYEPDLDADMSALIRSTLRAPAVSYPLRILYVEDSMISREVVRVVLTRAGHSVFCSDDGLAGVRALKSSAASLDLVITDHEMPGLDGLGVVKYLREIAYAGDILVHSGALDAELVAEYRKLGVRHFLPKPTHASELVASVAKAVAAAGADGSERTDGPG